MGSSNGLLFRPIPTRFSGRSFVGPDQHGLVSPISSTCARAGTQRWRMNCSDAGRFLDAGERVAVFGRIRAAGDASGCRSRLRSRTSGPCVAVARGPFRRTGIARRPSKPPAWGSRRCRTVPSISSRPARSSSMAAATARSVVAAHPGRYGACRSSRRIDPEIHLRLVHLLVERVAQRHHEGGAVGG
jgi:hypothetical protein